jgi:hypothetical protein
MKKQILQTLLLSPWQRPPYDPGGLRPWSPMNTSTRTEVCADPLDSHPALPYRARAFKPMEV